MNNSIDDEDYITAVHAAVAMSKRFEQDVAILQDLRCVLLISNDEPPIEIIRYDGQNTHIR